MDVQRLVRPLGRSTNGRDTPRSGHLLQAHGDGRSSESHEYPFPYGSSGHHFGRVEVLAHRASSVEMPGEEIQTVDGGSSGSGSGSGVPTGCDCVPSSVQIKNVSPYRSGKLYGHRFDVAVQLDYFPAPSGSTGQDARLYWYEKTDSPPPWQGLRPNVWNEMFALFPTSPTFDAWTKNRTKPCPGNETATIKDPPAESVDRPARTLEFDVYVRGSNISHNARAKQVLEPDGAGGVKTQTFTVLPSALGPLAGP